jgi:hypothetical protein
MDITFSRRKYFLTFLFQLSNTLPPDHVNVVRVNVLECVRVGGNEERNYTLFMMYM